MADIRRLSSPFSNANLLFTADESPSACHDKELWMRNEPTCGIAARDGAKRKTVSPLLRDYNGIFIPRPCAVVLVDGSYLLRSKVCETREQALWGP